jgi:hypothetical protein
MPPSPVSLSLCRHDYNISPPLIFMRRLELQSMTRTLPYIAKYNSVHLENVTKFVLLWAQTSHVCICNMCSLLLFLQTMTRTWIPDVNSDYIYCYWSCVVLHADYWIISCWLRINLTSDGVAVNNPLQRGPQRCKHNCNVTQQGSNWHSESHSSVWRCPLLCSAFHYTFTLGRFVGDWKGMWQLYWCQTFGYHLYVCCM